MLIEMQAQVSISLAKATYLRQIGGWGMLRHSVSKII